MKRIDIFRVVTLPIELILAFGICILVLIFTPRSELILMPLEEFSEKLDDKFKEIIGKADKILNIFALAIWILIFYAIYEKI